MADATNEGERLYALDRCEVLDTPPEEAFDRIVQLAVRLTGCPIAFISFIDDQRQWFKAQEGCRIRELPRDAGLCARVIDSDGAVVMPDISEDPRVATSALVKEVGGALSLAAAPIRSEDGLPIGLLAVLDTVHQDFSSAEVAALSDLSGCIQDVLELRLARLEIHKSSELLDKIKGEAGRSGYNDALTGVLSRHAFIAAGERELRRARRYRRPASVVIIDVDKFHKVNQTFGHRTGDALLVRLAAILRDKMREPDILGRYAGDQFAIFLPETDATAAEDVAERLRRDAGDYEVATNDGMFRFTISVGFAPISIGSEMFDEALDRAEASLHTGRGGVRREQAPQSAEPEGPRPLSFNAAAVPE